MKTILRLTLVASLFFLFLNEPPRKQAEAEDSPVEVNKTQVEKVSTPSASKPTPTPKPKPKPPMTNKEIGKQMASDKGWSGDQWLCLEKLWNNESNWRHTASNYQGSGAYGIPQALPASKMKSYGEDYLTNPRTQIAWGLDYIKNRYQSPCQALSFWNNQYPHWY